MGVHFPSDDFEREEMLIWAMSNIPNLRSLDKAYPIEVRRDGKRAAVAVYHEWRGQTVELSFVAVTPRWASKEVIAEILSWPFRVLKVRRIATITPAKNVRAIKLNKGLGFKQEGLLREVFDDDDAVLMAMVKTDFENAGWSKIGG